MPTSLRIGPYRFFFYAGDRSEPPHTPLQRDRQEAKFWISPVRLSWNRVFSSSELRKIEKIAEENERKLIETWDEFFNADS